jgi:hypothetical protein
MERKRQEHRADPAQAGTGGKLRLATAEFERACFLSNITRDAGESAAHRLAPEHNTGIGAHV